MEGTKFVPPMVSSSPPPMASMSPPPLADEYEESCTDAGFNLNMGHDDLCLSPPNLNDENENLDFASCGGLNSDDYDVTGMS